ncbi:MAG: Wadjet anti-phage system protein JetD domain-containing protein [Anaerobacillus sp.]|uniref:Wadjet anti-phage system protein JetD domain-containing protein n=1 Tax=Anaerobacillus sp. TaxID=1872506 RepID=UPI00391D1030
MDNIKILLATYEKKTVDLSNLEQLLMPFVQSYEEFATLVLRLEDEGNLLEVKAKKRTSRKPSLAYQYRIIKHLLTEDYHKEIQRYRQSLHPAINLDNYYSKDPAIWKHDLSLILKIDQYLKQNGLPSEQVPAPERSYELVGDEKWIVEQGGKELLERLQLFHLLQIIPVSEPLMFAINQKNFQEDHQFHLIVENKTTYQGLLPALKDTAFSTLVYGSGKAIINSIEQFSIQFPIIAEHHFLYFGDIDREGVSIWASLNKKQQIALALPFYKACISKKEAKGKENQRENEQALEQFLMFFSNTDQEKIRNLLKNGYYYPQETLKTLELQRIWRATDWTSMKYKN